MPEYPNQDERSAGERSADLRPRLAGVLCLVVGLLLVKWQILDSLHAASRGDETVVISTWAIIGAIYLPIIGLIYLIGGRKATALMHSLDNGKGGLNRRGVIVTVASVAVGLLLWILIQWSLSSQGYS